MSLNGRHCIVTAGPTLEPIDPVRFLSNRSSGKQGYAIAAALAERGASVTLVSGPTALDPPAGVTFRSVETALEMLAEVERALPADVFIAVAAVADWRPAERHAQKLKLDKGEFATLKLVENPDILKTVAQRQVGRPPLVIGFAAETHDLEAHAREKLKRKGCNWIVANDVSKGTMGGDENRILLIKENIRQQFNKAMKTKVAHLLADEISSFMFP